MGAGAVAEEVAAGVFGERVVDGLEEARPEPGVVFGSDVGGVVRELFERGWCGEDAEGFDAEDGEELAAGVRWEVEVGW